MIHEILIWVSWLLILTEDHPQRRVGEDDPGGDLSGGLPPGVLDEPDVGQEHQDEHDGVQGEDGGHWLPVREQRPALGDHPVLRGLVVDHPNDHKQEARRDLEKGVMNEQTWVQLLLLMPHLIAPEQDGLGPGHSEADQVKLLLLGDGQVVGIHLVHLFADHLFMAVGINSFSMNKV